MSFLENMGFLGYFLDDFWGSFSMICPWYPWLLGERTKKLHLKLKFFSMVLPRNQLQNSYKFIFKKNNDCQKMVIPPLKKSYDVLSPWFLPPNLPGRKILPRVVPGRTRHASPRPGELPKAPSTCSPTCFFLGGGQWPVSHQRWFTGQDGNTPVW